LYRLYENNRSSSIRINSLKGLLNIMKPIFDKILKYAIPFLKTRNNEIHTEICMQFAFNLLEEENGNEDIVIPAIILHDVGWSSIPEDIQLKAFGPGSDRELNRKHELEGVKIAKEILLKVGYDAELSKKILSIIKGHDSKLTADSINEKIVKDADKLWRYSYKGLRIDMKRFNEIKDVIVNRCNSMIDKWFFTETAKKIARKELESRIKELGM
jgi:HD superfamily phosphodiesterase